MKRETVLVLGASPKVERYSYRAIRDLLSAGHHVIPVAPKGGEILGIPCLTSLAEVTEEVNTLAMYIGEARSTLIIEDIIALKPDRIIFNPGTENSDLETRALEEGIETMEACTLVLLRTGQF